MTSNKSRYIAIGLLLVFGVWVLATLIPSGTKVKKAGRTTTSKTVEPSFQKEAELQIFSAPTGDTLANLDIELAESMAEIQYGMMYRKSMDPNTGMLFLMGEERKQSFYMKNTYVSLDIIYINNQNEIVSIQKNAKPLDETSLPSEGPASMVLEIKGGLSDEWGLEKGQKITWKRVN